MVQFLVSKGFIGGEKWKNVILVGTKKDRAEEGDVECFTEEVVPEMFAEAPGKTGTFALVSHHDYSELESAISALPNVSVKYAPIPEKDVASDLAPKIGLDVSKLSAEMRELRDSSARMQQQLQAADAERKAMVLKLKAEQLEAKRKADQELAKAEEEKKRLQELAAKAAAEKERIERLRREENERAERAERRARQAEADAAAAARRQAEAEAEARRRADAAAAARRQAEAEDARRRAPPPTYRPPSPSYSHYERPSSSSYEHPSSSSGRSYCNDDGSRFTGSRCYSVASNATGPLTKSGRPDMRYSANRR